MADANEVVVPPQNPEPPAPIPPKGNEVDTVTIPKSEFEDLKHRADVSSQNFERAKKGEQKVEELQAEIESLKTQVPSDFRDERVGELQAEIAQIRAKQAKSDLVEKYPVLKGEWDAFEAFRNEPDNKGMNINTAAKAFLTEKGLLGSPQPRAGLERPTGGQPAPVQTGKMSAEEAKKLRESDPKKYRDMLKKGLINVA